MYSNANLLLTLLIRAKSIRGGQSLREKTELLDELMAFVAEHLQERITICDTARQLHVSESTLTHLCTKRLGLSFYRYVTQRRLIAAKNMIGEKISLEEIAHRVGFADYSTFYRAFKQEFGISPRKFGKL